MSDQPTDDVIRTPDISPEKTSNGTPEQPAAHQVKPTSTEQPAAQKPEAAVVKEPEAAVVKQPETAAAQEPKEAAVVKEPEAAVAKEPEAVAVKEPTAASTAQAPEAAVVKEPETAAVKEPPPAAQPAAPSNVALVVDDEPANRDFLMRLLEQTGLQVKGASDGREALDIAQRYESIALLAIDHKLPDMEGVDLIRKLRERFPTACFVMATMLDERALMSQAFENGCNVFLVKPHGFMELFRRLQEIGPDPAKLDRLVIDQYGLRPYRG